MEFEFLLTLFSPCLCTTDKPIRTVNISYKIEKIMIIAKYIHRNAEGNMAFKMASIMHANRVLSLALHISEMYLFIYFSFVTHIFKYIFAVNEHIKRGKRRHTDSKRETKTHIIGASFCRIAKVFRCLKNIRNA